MHTAARIPAESNEIATLQFGNMVSTYGNPANDRREISAHQVRKMKAAVGYVRSLIGIEDDVDQNE